MRIAIAIAASLLCAVLSGTTASRAQNAPVSDVVWLCQPGAPDNPCASNLRTAVVRADKVTAVRDRTIADHPPIDCFYVYPTVSRERTTNSDLVVHDEERNVARSQAAPFSQVCRVWAPMYRSQTVSALFGEATKADAGGPSPDQIAFASVDAAWHAYLAHENDGRPFVLIGHSQGTFMLTELVQREIDGDPALRARLVSALLIGGNVLEATTPQGNATFKHLPACRAATQVQCVIAYSSFLGAPPPDAYFGIAAQGEGPDRKRIPGVRVMCTNPAALGGGEAPLRTEVTNSGRTGRPDGADETIPWLSYPGAFSAACTTTGDATYLDVRRTDGATRFPRVAELPTPAWGLHIVDVSLALGDLVADVGAQAATITATH